QVIQDMRRQVAPYKFPLALTECHFTMPGRNRCDLNSCWAAGVAYARFLNLHQRHGDLLKIANLADFCGTRWQSNAIMLPVPGGKAYMMPVAKVMALYRKHSGRQFVAVSQVPEFLDVVASRSDNTLFLHVVNTHRTQARQLNLSIPGRSIQSGKSFTIAAPPDAEIFSAANDPMTVKEQSLTLSSPLVFPPASVTALELVTRA
ncbi:MAG TPA: alpha-L-arabinofuranosidase C-terminal domain-containing protein, partial [Bacillota bacterium]|nr:alpha-L-arabinofuranosidase C-terminal domain-containing protein [Bacillota bacterium]